MNAKQPTPNTAQQLAIETVRHLIARDFSYTEKLEYGAQITAFDVTCRVLEHSNLTFTSLSVETEYTALPTTNLLRALSHDYYLFFIGERGKVTLASGPKSLAQFAGKKYGSWHFAPTTNDL